jgi:transcriptional regulator with XRE-family HTH domain
MVERAKSRKSDAGRKLSRKRDAWLGLVEMLRQARLDQQLSQSELAGKVDLHQRQISDLERAAADPRLSTLLNVARALELELVLVPRHLLPAVHALYRARIDAGNRPAYVLADEDTPDTLDEAPASEVGDGRETGGAGRPRAPAGAKR